ncbi:MAG: lmo0937 family membrane protein [Terriglobales bacterium]
MSSKWVKPYPCGPGELMLWTIVAILLIMWLLGFGFKVGGSLIHALLVIAIVVALFNLLSGRRAI